MDLQGNLIWYYDDSTLPPSLIPTPAKLLANGDVLINYGWNGELSILREVDLAGDTIWQLGASDIQALIEAKGCFPGQTVTGPHHDFAALPNRHLVLIVQLLKDFTDLPGYPGVTTVIGDGLIDLDRNHNVVWCWSEFDHLDVNRHPYGFPDWTHTNAVLYSTSDGNLIVSSRHQSWIMKVRYSNGSGDGGVIWRLGYQGDFALDANDPSSWFFAQHGPWIFADDGRSHVTLGVYDNGNDRVMDSGGDLCGIAGQAPCQSRASVFEIDENNESATPVLLYDLPYLSFFGGNVETVEQRRYRVRLGCLRSRRGDDRRTDRKRSAASGVAAQRNRPVCVPGLPNTEPLSGGELVRLALLCVAAPHGRRRRSGADSGALMMKRKRQAPAGLLFLLRPGGRCGDSFSRSGSPASPALQPPSRFARLPRAPPSRSPARAAPADKAHATGQVT